jgi:uncharacterized protein YdhG (YjbR/CyaY superfamily)
MNLPSGVGTAVSSETDVAVKTPIKQVTTIDEYINGFPESVRKALLELRATIKRTAPEATETISYRVPTFQYHGNLVHFAAFKNHIGFYPTASGIAAFERELKAYKRSKGAVQFPMDQPLPLKTVEKIVKFRLKENLQRNSAKTK